jgi:hypothetical protein
MCTASAAAHVKTGKKSGFFVGTNATARRSMVADEGASVPEERQVN